MTGEYAIQGSIAELFREAARFNGNDPLVSLRLKKFVPLPGMPPPVFTLPKDEQLRKLVTENDLFAREKGIGTLCLAFGSIGLKHGQHEVQSPVFLYPLTYAFSRIHDAYTFEFSESNCFFNPFLEKEYPELLPDEGIAPGEHLLQLEERNYRIDRACAIDNFHYHRRSIIHDLSKLSGLPLNSAASRLLSGSDEMEKKPVFPGIERHFFEISPEQHAVLNGLQTDHVVLQGPPGTGKSQVIAECAVQGMHAGLQTLIVSEKKVALDVIAGKLVSAGLGPFAYCFTASANERHFIGHLRETWNVLETLEPTGNYGVSRTGALMQQLSFYLELHRREDLIGGMSFSDFFTRFRGIRTRSLPFYADLPQTADIVQLRDEIEFITQNELQELVASFRTGQPDPGQLTELFDTIREVQKKLPEILALCRELGERGPGEQLTARGVGQLRRLAVEAQVLESRAGRKYRRFASKKAAKTIEKLQARAQRIARNHSFVGELRKKWKILPSEADIVRFQSYREQSWNQRRRTKRFFRKMAFDRAWNLEDALADLERTELYRILQARLYEELAGLGISDLSELQEIHSFITVWRPLHEMHLPEKLIAPLSELNALLTRLDNRLNRFFDPDQDTDLAGLFHRCLQNEAVIRLHASKWNKLPKGLAKLLPGLGDFENVLLHAAKRDYLIFEERFPEFSGMQEGDLLAKAEAILREQRSDRIHLRQEIFTQIANKFAKFNELLRIPSRKLSHEEKQQKQLLRKGKQVLVKAFARKKRYPSVRNLLNSEARPWIDLLAPVLLCNPEQAASVYPLKADCLDLLIFDEATQIPFYNALPLAFRAKRVLVAGDEQQMGPSLYFDAGSRDVIDLLHEAQYQFSVYGLHDHLRSEHPALIAFSNRYFYRRSLRPYPAAKAVSEPFVFTYVPDAVYSEGTNAKEAEAVAAKLTGLLHETDSVGLVAFSEKQLEKILSFLGPAARSLLEKRLESGNGFAKPLEKVQGDECDVLLISLGYGKDENGDFALRFGPLNYENGARRLNVLMTRARRKIIFNASVRASDFPVSANESVNLLKNLLSMLEKGPGSAGQATFPLEENAFEVRDQTVYLKRVAHTFKTAEALVSFCTIAAGKGWKIAIL